jgi:hypothetical protein
VTIVAAVSVGGELLLPTHGLGGFVLRALALAAIPVLLAPELLRLRAVMAPAAGPRSIARS